MNSAGGIGTSSASRARMLHQQRELQLKKRQSSASSGMLASQLFTLYPYFPFISFTIGMVRSSLDKDTSSTGQFTPMVRQFSAPKASTFNDE